MPLVQETLKTEIKSLLNSLKSETNQEQAIEKLATDLTQAVDAYIKSATITVTGTSQTGGSVTGTGTIS